MIHFPKKILKTCSNFAARPSCGKAVQITMNRQNVSSTFRPQWDRLQQRHATLFRLSRFENEWMDILPDFVVCCHSVLDDHYCKSHCGTMTFHYSVFVICLMRQVQEDFIMKLEGCVLPSQYNSYPK